MMSSKENSSIYMGGYIGTPGVPLSHNQSISNDITQTKPYNENRQRQDSLVG